MKRILYTAATLAVVSIAAFSQAQTTGAKPQEAKVHAEGFTSGPVSADTRIAAEGFTSGPETLGTGVQSNALKSGAVYDTDGKMKRPANIDRWVFLGSSLGMTYMDAEMDPEDPGYFSTVMIAPDAYRYFRETGAFADGTVFAKIIHQSNLGHGGVSMGDNIYLEVHVKDKNRYGESGSGFYAWAPNDADFAEAFPDDMGCVACHQKSAAYADVFTQFYPTIRSQAEAAKATRADKAD